MEKLQKDRILARAILEKNTQPGIIQNRKAILKAIIKDSFELWIWAGFLDLAVRVPQGIYHLSMRA